MNDLKKGNTIKGNSKPKKNLPFYISKRYFFGKKSTNAINVISYISVGGIALGTAALLLVSSVFNGFEDLIKSLYGSFQPDIMITPKEGKVFIVDDETYKGLTEIDGVEYVSKSLEEIAFFEYKDGQDFGLIKGVDEHWINVTRLDTVIYDGVYKLKSGNKNLAVVGYGMRNKLGISVENVLSQLSVYMLKNKQVGPLEKPFKKQYLQPAGIFSIQQQFDEKYVISDLDFAQKLRGYKNSEISQLEIKIKPNTSSTEIIRSVQRMMGQDYHIKNRYEQNEAFFKLMKVEKWMGFAIIGLTVILVAINMVGCMFMLVHEKKKDIAILKSMGANNHFIRNIFTGVGLWMCGIGMLIGFVGAVGFYQLHKWFNLIPMEGFIVDAYPMEFRAIDFIATIIFVLLFGILFSLYPASKAAKIKSLVRND